MRWYIDQHLHLFLTISAVIAAALSLAQVQGLGKYNPCAPPGPATKGRGFYVGVAFWPGGLVEDWLPAYDSSTGAWGLNPCNTSSTFNNTGQSDAAYLAAQGVVTAAFELKVDTLMLLQFNVSLIDRLFATAPTVISAVVYRAGYRSEAVYIRSEDAFWSHGTGYVQNLVLSAAFAGGQLTYLQWDDVTCNNCGGPSSRQCIITTTSQPQHSCATSDEDCAGQDCSLTLFVGFTGSDRNGIALQTGSQINRLNQYSVSSLYNSVVSQVSTTLATAQRGNIGETPSTPDAASGDAS